MSRCHCCSGKQYAECCEPVINGKLAAKSAEELMRSRFTAYCIRDYQYIFETYGSLQRSKLSTTSLADSAENTRWIGLEVVKYKSLTSLTATVEFIATYAEGKTLFQMHELSDFERQDGVWRYTSGVMKDKTGKIKLSRNAPCPCQSGKKFKQCCMTKI